MKISLKELEVFSQCPARVKFERTGRTPHNLELNIVESVVKKCYLKATETGYRAEWRRIVAWVDKEAFKDINVLQKDSYELGKKTSEHCLVFLRTWYEALYLKEDVSAYIDIDISVDLGDDTVHTVIPIVKSDGDSIQILQITDVPKENKQLFNSVEARGMTMLLSQHLVEEHIHMVSIALGKLGGFKVAEIRTKIEDHVRIRERLTALINAYKRGYNYPSVTEHCNSCPYTRRCKL